MSGSPDPYSVHSRLASPTSTIRRNCKLTSGLFTRNIPGSCPCGPSLIGADKRAYLDARTRSVDENVAHPLPDVWPLSDSIVHHVSFLHLSAIGFAGSFRHSQARRRSPLPPSWPV